MSSRGVPQHPPKGTPKGTKKDKENKDPDSPAYTQEPVKSLGMLDTNSDPNSFDVVLKDTYLPAKDVAVERPISMSAPAPINFGMVLPGLYRSGYPQATDFSFMKSLKLKTIVTLVSKDMPDGYQQFMDENRITHRVFDMAGTKKEDIPLSMMKSITSVVMNRDNYPLLVHCNQGKHRTGCVVAIIRKQSPGWDINAIIQEYTEFAAPKVRDSDVAYIRNFRVADISCVKGPLRSMSTTKALHVGTTFLLFLSLAFSALCIWASTSWRLISF